MKNRILLAIDDTKASERAVRYVGDLLGHGEAHVRLLHVLPPIPPAMMEAAGSTAPAEGLATKRRADLAELRWTAERAKEAHPTLERMRRLLLEDGIGEGRVKLDFHAPAPEESIPQVLLDQANENDCDTIVVGYHTLPWYKQVFHKHVSEWLIRHAKDHTIWVIE